MVEPINFFKILPNLMATEMCKEDRSIKEIVKGAAFCLPFNTLIRYGEGTNILNTL